MKISVLIPTYNRAQEVTRAIDSVLGQTIPPSEIIVVDDGSTDETRSLLSRYENGVVKTFHQSNRGVAASRNRAIREAKEEWIAFLDSDDWWLPQKMEKQTAFHGSFPKLMVSQTDELWLRNGVRVNPKKHHQKPSGWIFTQCLERCLISPSAVLIHRKVFDQVDLFDESLPACEDYDLWLRVSRLFEVGLVIDKLVVKTGGHSDQLSSKHWGLDRFRVKALEKILSYPLSEAQQRDVIQTLITKLIILQQGGLKRGNEEQVHLYQQKIRKYESLVRSL